MSDQITIDTNKLNNCIDELNLVVGNDEFNILFKYFNIRFTTKDINRIIDIIGGKKKKDIIEYFKKQSFTLTDLENYIKLYLNKDETTINLNSLYQDLQKIFNLKDDFNSFDKSIRDKLGILDDASILKKDFNEYLKKLI